MAYYWQPRGAQPVVRAAVGKQGGWPIYVQGRTSTSMCKFLAMRPDEVAARALRQSAASDALTAVNVAMGWWLERLMCYDFMPNERGVIVADVATWTCVYEDEFVPECN
eukprot:scaffold49594_cov360-Isochrysis_galbana.AAC.1